MVALKVCGVTRPEDLELCEDLGIEAVGINLWQGSPRGLTLAAARTLVRAVPRRGATRRVGVFVDASPHDVAEAVAELALDLVQLHGDAPHEPYAALGFPWIRVVRGTPPLHALDAPRPAPAWVLLDARVEGYGGSGTTTDWTWARTAVEHHGATPVWLAGGITPANAAEAIARVGPAGLDVASGVESAPGIKDPAAVRALWETCRTR